MARCSLDYAHKDFAWLPLRSAPKDRAPHTDKVGSKGDDALHRNPELALESQSHSVRITRPAKGPTQNFSTRPRRLAAIWPVQHFFFALGFSDQAVYFFAERQFRRWVAMEFC
jgi:hypothetical protein